MTPRELVFGFHYQIGNRTWYRQEDDLWVEPGADARVMPLDWCWYLVTEDGRERRLTDVVRNGHTRPLGGIKRALQWATEELDEIQAERDAELDRSTRQARIRRRYRQGAAR